MDDRRFDQLAKAIAGEAGSRREALGLAAGSAAAAVLGFLGMDEATFARRRNKNKNKNKRNRKNNKEKKTKICHCPDASGNNCKTKKFSEKKAKKHLRQHPNDFRGKCNNDCFDRDAECNVNRPAECCHQNCCLDTTSGTGGICASSGGRCCGQHLTGGYCSEFFPQCCGQSACCGPNDTCCGTPQDPTGYCCPPGQICCVSPSGCCVAQTAASAEGAEGLEDGFRSGSSRVRAGG